MNPQYILNFVKLWEILRIYVIVIPPTQFGVGIS